MTLTPNDLVALELGRAKIEAILLKAQIEEMRRVMKAASGSQPKEREDVETASDGAWSKSGDSDRAV